MSDVLSTDLMLTGLLF